MSQDDPGEYLEEADPDGEDGDEAAMAYDGYETTEETEEETTYGGTSLLYETNENLLHIIMAPYNPYEYGDLPNWEWWQGNAQWCLFTRQVAYDVEEARKNCIKARLMDAAVKENPLTELGNALVQMLDFRLKRGFTDEETQVLAEMCVHKVNQADTPWKTPTGGGSYSCAFTYTLRDARIPAVFSYGGGTDS